MPQLFYESPIGLSERLDLITDGDSQGPDPVPYARIFKDAGNSFEFDRDV